MDITIYNKDSETPFHWEIESSFFILILSSCGKMINNYEGSSSFEHIQLENRSLVHDYEHTPVIFCFQYQRTKNEIRHAINSP